VQNAAREPGYYRNNPDDIQKALRLTNIIKRHKVTDFTRPNKFGTTTSKVATRSPGRTRLWK
jgi:hypothetical protein